MSYQGKNFRRFQNNQRSGATQGGGGKPDEKVGGAAKAGSQDPFLNEISAIAVERYIEAVHQHSLTHHALISPWIRGRIPIVLLEHELPRTQEKLLGRMAKHHTRDDGSASTVNLTAAEVRTLMIDEVVAENVRRSRLVKDTDREIGVSSMESESISSGGKKGAGVGQAKDSKTKIGGSSTDAGQSLGGSKAESDVPSTETNLRELKEEALLDLFPHNAKKSRETERSNLWKEASTILGKMFYYWPSKDIQTKMQATPALVDAFESNDVIRFIDEMRIFSLTGSGNPEANRDAAEAHLMSLEMKSGKALEYFKAFTEAVEHIRICRSSFTEFKVVDLFFRNIDQTSFPNWYVKFLTEDDPMFRFQKLKYEEAKEHAMKYHNDVIRANVRPSAAGKDKDKAGDSKKPNPVRSMNHLMSTLAGGGAKGPIAVDATVLTTLLQQAKAGNKKRKAEGKEDEEKTGVKEEPTNKKNKKEPNAAEKKICWKFRDEGTCQFGQNCYFAHTK